MKNVNLGVFKVDAGREYGHIKESLTSKLAEAVLSLLVSLIKKGNPLKFKQFFMAILRLSSFLVSSCNNTDSSYKRSYRK